MTVIGRLRAALMAEDLRPEPAKYADGSSASMRQWQLDAFNRQWKLTSQQVPYWATLKKDRGLPEQFETWEQVCGSLPVLERADLQTRLPELCVPGSKPYAWRATGGSTGQPVRVPVSRSEIRLAAADMWHARSWFGISPSDRAFLIWGHSHLLGHGVAGWVRGRIRVGKDALIGYRRWSAYRLGDADLREAADDLLRFRPGYILGYAVGLDRFARVNASRTPQLRTLNLKAVIATGESFPRADSRQVLEEVFGCPVVMEYGAVETGAIAHEVPAGGYRVFWRHYFAEVLPSRAVPDSWELVLTSLYPRALPLIRYRIGDLIAPCTEVPDRPLLKFRSLIGRCNDMILLPHGRQVHSEAMAHVMRDTPVTGYQVVQRSPEDLTLRYTSAADLPEADIRDLRHKLGRIARDLAMVRIERVPQLQQTVAGKTRAICDVPASDAGTPARLS